MMITLIKFFLLQFQELNKRQSQLESAHAMLMRHHEQTHELEAKQQRSVHNLREDHVKRQHQTELNNQVRVLQSCLSLPLDSYKIYI